MSQEARELVRRLRKRLGGIDLPQAGTDNLAIVLATYFDDGGEERNKHPAWSDAAIGGAESSLDAIHAHYATTITTLLDKLAAERKRNDELADLAQDYADRLDKAGKDPWVREGALEIALGQANARAEAAERERDEAAKELEALTVGSNALLASQNEIVHKITARADKLAAALEPFAGDKLPGNNRDHIEYDRFGLRRLMSDMEIARRNAFFALHPEQHPLARSALADKGVAKNG